MSAVKAAVLSAFATLVFCGTWTSCVSAARARTTGLLLAAPFDSATGLALPARPAGRLKAEIASLTEQGISPARAKEAIEVSLISPAPTSSAPLEFTATSGKAIFETTGSSKIECKEGTDSGKFEAVREGEATFTMHGCKTILGIGCKTSGQTAETMSMVAEVEFVDLEKTSLTLGVEIELTEPKVECGTTSVVIEGTAIGEVAGVESGGKTKTATIVFKQASGKQAIQECHLPKTFCENGPFILDTTINGESYSESGVEMEEKLTFAKETTLDF